MLKVTLAISNEYTLTTKILQTQSAVFAIKKMIFLQNLNSLHACYLQLKSFPRIADRFDRGFDFSGAAG